MSAARLAVITLVGLALTSPARAQEGDLKKGLDLVKEGKHAEAAAILEPIVEKDGKNFQALLGLATAKYHLDEISIANAYAVRAEQIDPKSVEAAGLVGKSFFWMAEDAKTQPGATAGKIEGLYEEAANGLKKACELDPKITEHWWLRARSLRNIRRFDEAVAVYKEGLKLDPKNADFLAEIIETHVWAQNFGEAAKAADEAIKAMPEAARVHLMKADALRNAGKIDAAVSAYAAALMAADSTPEADDEIARGLWNLTVGGANKDVARALACFRQWAEKEPSSYLPYYWVAWAQMESGKYDDAVLAFKKGDEATGGKYPRAKLGVAQALSRKGSVEEACEAFLAAYKSNPALFAENNEPLTEIRVAVGSMVEKEDFERAVACLEKYAMKIDENHWGVLQDLAFCYREWGSQQRSKPAAAKDCWQKSVDHYVKASKLIEKDGSAEATRKAQVLNDTGLMYHYHMDDLKTGLDYYKKALAADPNYTDALENSGLVMAKLGKYEEALAFFEKVLAQPQQENRMVSKRGREEALKKLGRQ